MKIFEHLFENQAKKLTSHSLYPIGLTFLAFLTYSLINNGAEIHSVIMLLVVCVFQVFLEKYEKIDYAIVKLEVKRKPLRKNFRAWSRKVCLVSALLPIIGILSSVAMWAIFIFLVSLFIKDFLNIFTRLRNRKELKKASLSFLKDYKPTIIVYVTGMKEVAYQINQWIPVLESLKVNVAIIIRETSIYDNMENTHIPVLTAKTQLELEALLGPHTQVKKVLYPANTMKNVQSLRYAHLQHYFINHGESDKSVNQSKFLMAYDKLLLAGPISECRLRNAGIPIREEQIEYVGRPQAEMLLNIKEKVDTIKTILYAPTWEGYVKKADYSSVDENGYSFCKQLLESGRFKVLFKPHPYTGKISTKNKIYLEKIKKLFILHNQPIFGDEASIYDLMNQSDALICDISSVLNEYLVTMKPILLYRPSLENSNFFDQEFPSSKAASLIDYNSDVAMVLSDIEKSDKLYENRKDVRRRSLGEFSMGALVKFIQVVENDLDRR